MKIMCFIGRNVPKYQGTLCRNDTGTRNASKHTGTRNASKHHNWSENTKMGKVHKTPYWAKGCVRNAVLPQTGVLATVGLPQTGVLATVGLPQWRFSPSRECITVEVFTQPGMYHSRGCTTVAGFTTAGDVPQWRVLPQWVLAKRWVLAK